MSFHRLHELVRDGVALDNIIRTYDTCAERINYIKEFLYDTLEYDCSEYLSQILSLDALLLNPDRHFNNLGIVINNQTGKCRTAPIFDNGAALLSNYRDYPCDIPFEEHIQHVTAQPFSSNFITMVYTPNCYLNRIPDCWMYYIINWNTCEILYPILNHQKSRL